jgi:hypothetical protein
MNCAQHARRIDERGMTTAAMAFAVGMSFVVLFWSTNAIVFWYVKGAVRQSLDEGIHAGVAVGPDGNAIAACSDRLDEALNGLLAAPMRAGVRATCSDEGATLRTTATINLNGWGGNLFGGVLSFNDTLVRRAPYELDPAKRPGI